MIDEVLKNTPLNKAAEPSDIAETSLFLASINPIIFQEKLFL